MGAAGCRGCWPLGVQFSRASACAYKHARPVTRTHPRRSSVLAKVSAGQLADQLYCRKPVTSVAIYHKIISPGINPAGCRSELTSGILTQSLENCSDIAAQFEKGGGLSDVATGVPFEVSIEPHNDQYDPDDDRWQDQVASLYTDLSAEVGATRRSRPVEGTKGAVDQVILALGSAGMVQAAVDCLRAWLGRDRDRRIDVRWEEDGASRSVTLSGEAVDVATIHELAQAAIDRVGGPSWPSGTAPS